MYLTQHKIFNQQILQLFISMNIYSDGIQGSGNPFSAVKSLFLHIN